MTLSLLFGSVRLVLGVIIAIKAFKKRVPTEPLNFFDRYPTFVKALSLVLILSGLHTIFWGTPASYSSTKKQVWSEEDRLVLIKNCLRDVKESRVELMPATQKYCECAVDGVMKNMSKSTYLESIKRSFDDQVNFQLKYFEACLLELEKSRIEILNAK
jgi:hypothetical protein